MITSEYVVPELGTYLLVLTICAMSKSLHSIENERLVAWLKFTRESKELTMRELALKLDKPHSYVGKTEQGERRLDVARCS